MNKEHYKVLAKEVISKYPCGIHICINPYYWQDNGSICGLGDFKPTDVDKLAELLEDVSNQIYKETGYCISSIDWLDIFPEDESLLDDHLKETTESFEVFLSSL